MMYGYGGHGWLWMLLMMLLFWGGLAGIIALVWYLVTKELREHRQARGWSPGGPGGPGVVDPAEGLLRERLGRGEITEEEYRRLLAVLRGAP